MPVGHGVTFMAIPWPPSFILSSNDPPPATRSFIEGDEVNEWRVYAASVSLAAGIGTVENLLDERKKGCICSSNSPILMRVFAIVR
jgi:hypothetical protein